MADLLSGTILRDAVKKQLSEKIVKLHKKPTLAIIQVGSRSDSNAYINQKKIFAEAIGAHIIHTQFKENVNEHDILQEIVKFNQDSNIHGILVQLPLPQHLMDAKEKIIDRVSPEKDVDGLSSLNTKYLFDGTQKGYLPATTRSIISILDHYKVEIKGKHCVVIGRSTLVGKPTALALLNRDATVTIAHKETKHLKDLTKQADILVVAIGDPLFIGEDFVTSDQVIIDVGINEVEGTRKLVGDVDFKNVEPRVNAITPVPGGVGPMTVASLFENLLDAFIIQEKI